MIPPQYRNVLCPWQSENDLKVQIKTLNRLMFGLSVDRRREILRLDLPDRVWQYSCISQQ